MEKENNNFKEAYVVNARKVLEIVKQEKEKEKNKIEKQGEEHDGGR